MAATLTARGVRKSFGGVEVLHGVSLDAAGGSILGVLGENGAGKSTLMKILTGDYEPDEASIEVGGRTYAKLNPREARGLGIRMISQELQDAPTLSVAENISLGRLPARGFVVSRREMRARAQRVLKDMHVELDVDAKVGALRTGQRQVVEIARALSDEARVLLLDEPTSALSHEEAQRLFGYLRRLRDNGVAIVYITHRLDEVHELCDRVEVLRDGNVAAIGKTEELDRAALVSAMIGRSAGVARPEPASWELGKAPALEFRRAGVRAIFEDVDLYVLPGEIVAVYGRLGAGAEGLLEAAFGLRRLTSGELLVKGTPRQPKGAADAIKLGIGFVPPERKAEGVFAVRPVGENVSVPSWRRLAVGGVLIRRAAEAAAYRRQHEALHVRSRNDPMQPMMTLSGGNQQKVVLGRWLERGTPILLMAEPTRGVDVGARAELYRSMRRLASHGFAILVASSDYEEVVQVADRAIVLSRGRVAAELGFDDITTDRLLRAAGG